MKGNKSIVRLDGFALEEWDNIITYLRKKTLCKTIIAIECNFSVHYEELKEKFLEIDPILVVDTRELFLSQDEIGKLDVKSISDYFDFHKLQKAREAIDSADDNVIVIGCGAHLVSEDDILIYTDLESGEKQSENIYFNNIELLDLYRKSIVPYIDYWLDANNFSIPKMTDKKTLEKNLNLFLDGSTLQIEINGIRFQI